MGKSKSAAALRQQQRNKARDEKNYSTSTSATDTPEVRSRSPEIEESDDASEDDEDISQFQPKSRRYPPDAPTLEALLEELALDTDINATLLPPSPSSSEPLYEIRPSPGKGLGLFATIDIPRGTRIMTDESLFVVIGPEAMISEIEAAFSDLSPEKQSLYLSLRCPDFAGTSPIIRRWDANCFAMDHDTGIFPLASRINHSCTPNALFKWNSNIQRETIHAIVDIAKGTEIEISYVPPHRDIGTRRKKMGHYGFECGCEPCKGETEEGRRSEDRRWRMTELLNSIEHDAKKREEAKKSAGADGAEARDAAKVEEGERKVMLDRHLEMIRLLEEEMLFQKELGDQYRYAAGCYKADREKEKAVEYARMGLQNDVRCMGADSPLVQEAVEFLRSMKGI